MWTENVIKKTCNQSEEATFKSVDAEIEKLDKTARASAFQQDCLKLTRDCAQLAQLFKSETQHERAKKLQKVTHLKNQNAIGAAAVSNYMSKNIRFVGGRVGEIETAMDEAGLLSLTDRRQGVSTVLQKRHLPMSPSQLFCLKYSSHSSVLSEGIECKAHRTLTLHQLVPNVNVLLEPCLAVRQ